MSDYWYISDLPDDLPRLDGYPESPILGELLADHNSALQGTMLTPTASSGQQSEIRTQLSLKQQQLSFKMQMEVGEVKIVVVYRVSLSRLIICFS
jgi:hypothetical protein